MTRLRSDMTSLTPRREWPSDEGGVQDKFRIMIVTKETLEVIKETPVDQVRMEDPLSEYFGER